MIFFKPIIPRLQHSMIPIVSEANYLVYQKLTIFNKIARHQQAKSGFIYHYLDFVSCPAYMNGSIFL
jgi:hypothetical protein